jgi:hypothetical protein
MNHTKVVHVKGPLLRSTGRSDYVLFQDDDFVTTMMRTPYGKIMSLGHTADRSIKSIGKEGDKCLAILLRLQACTNFALPVHESMDCMQAS